MHNEIPRRRGKEEAKRLEREIMAKHLPNLMKNLNLHNQEAQNTESKVSSKRPTPRNIIKMLKDKGKKKILKQQDRSRSSCEREYQ